jgi:hypothetical protein
VKREARVLVNKATDSLFLSIDHFNRPYDRGRHEAVLIFLDRAFELLLKAVIIHRGGKIRERRATQTIGFDKCLRKCVSDQQAKCLIEEEALTVQNINTLRDAAQHYLVDLSEQHLYLHTQAGLTLFSKVLKDAFGQTLTDYFPGRVLPVTTSPPQEFAAVLNAEFADIKQLVAPRSRKRLQALAKLRSIAILEKSLSGDRTQPSEAEMRGQIKKIAKGMPWTRLFPGVASLRLETTGTGFDVSLRITKSEGEPVRLVSEDTPGATIVAVKRVNELDYYSLGLKQLARKVGLTEPKTLAVVRALGIQDRNEFFKPIRIGSQLYKRYSRKALERIKAELPKLDLDTIWRDYNPTAWRGRSTC